MAAIAGIESVQPYPYPYFPLVGAAQFRMAISTCLTQSVTISAGNASPGMLQPSSYQIPSHHSYSGGGGYQLFQPSQLPHLGITHCDHHDL